MWKVLECYLSVRKTQNGYALKLWTSENNHLRRVIRQIICVRRVVGLTWKQEGLVLDEWSLFHDPSV